MTIDIRICFIGDSFINGIGDPDYLGWAGRVCKNASTKDREITYYNLGIRRDTSSNITKRWKDESYRRFFAEADNRLVFSFGVNDTIIEEGKLRVKTEQSIQNTYDIISAASKTYPVIMIGPPPIDDPIQNPRIKTLDDGFQSICRELSTPYLSIFDSLIKEPVWINEVASNDGAHPRASGYTCLAQLIQKWDEWWF